MSDFNEHFISLFLLYGKYHQRAWKLCSHHMFCFSSPPHLEVRGSHHNTMSNSYILRYFFVVFVFIFIHKMVIIFLLLMMQKAQGTVMKYL